MQAKSPCTQLQAIPGYHRTERCKSARGSHLHDGGDVVGARAAAAAQGIDQALLHEGLHLCVSVKRACREALRLAKGGCPEACDCCEACDMDEQDGRESGQLKHGLHEASPLVYPDVSKLTSKQTPASVCFTKQARS